MSYTKLQDEEQLTIDGHNAVLRFSATADNTAISNVKQILFGGSHFIGFDPESCNNSKNMI